MSIFPLLYLLSGVVLNTLSQHITDLRFSAPEAHIVPFVKFSATLVGAALRRPAQSAATREQTRLMAAIGLLDASAYTVYCLGFFRLGATLSNLVLSGVGQVLTAAFTRFLLRKRLTNGQVGGILFVGLGLAIRAAPATYVQPGSSSNSSRGSGSASQAAAAGAGLAALSPEQLQGVAMVALAALLYSLLGVAYEKLLKGPTSPPPNGEIMWNVSILGFLASAAYQALYTLPNWERLVGRHLAAAAAAGRPPAYVAGLLALFGGLFNLHMLVQAAVFKSEGAIGVGLVNAVRGAAITLVVAALFCDAERPHLCLTRQTLASAAVTTVGGAIYVLAGGQRQPPAQPRVAAAKAGTAQPATGAAAAGQEGATAAAGDERSAEKDKDA